MNKINKNKLIIYHLLVHVVAALKFRGRYVEHIVVL